MVFDSGEMDEEVLVSLVYLIPGAMLRRWVARALWFDMTFRPDVHMPVLKELADFNALDPAIDFTEEDYRSALLVVGYSESQVSARMRVHHDQRLRELSGTTPPERDRLLSGEDIRREM